MKFAIRFGGREAAICAHSSPPGTDITSFRREQGRHANLFAGRARAHNRAVVVLFRAARSRQCKVAVVTKYQDSIILIV